MDLASIRDRLKPTNGTTWRAELGSEQARLFDCPIAIEISTRSVPDDSPVPEISNAESHLADMVLLGLDKCLSQCERLLDADPTIRHIRISNDARVANPHIWIDREMMTENGPTRWAMVLGIDVNPDFGWHIEFDGLDALEIWAGD
jgi:hypothetical protein